jgi:hypothetical protein
VRTPVIHVAEGADFLLSGHKLLLRGHLLGLAIRPSKILSRNALSVLNQSPKKKVSDSDPDKRWSSSFVGMSEQFADAGEAGESSTAGKRKLEEAKGGDFELELAREWAEVPRVGDLVADSTFIPFKRPMSMEGNEKMDEAERYSSIVPYLVYFVLFCFPSSSNMLSPQSGPLLSKILATTKRHVWHADSVPTCSWISKQTKDAE